MGLRSRRQVSDLLGEGQGVGAAIVGDGDVTLFDVNVGRAILSHRAQLHQMAVRLELLCQHACLVPAINKMLHMHIHLMHLA